MVSSILPNVPFVSIKSLIELTDPYIDRKLLSIGEGSRSAYCSERKHSHKLSDQDLKQLKIIKLNLWLTAPKAATPVN